MFVPNTTIRFMKGVPLDSTYRNTLWFETLEDQTEHFMSSYEYKLYSNQTYQRVGKGKLRVKEFPEHMYSYNYLAFRNNYKTNGTPFEEGKIFYCFITGVEYINENTTEVSYVIDYMQTWFFDYDLGMCFVEREHSETDEIGDNIIPEGLEIGEYISGAPSFISNVTNDEGKITQYGLNDLRICVAASVNINLEDVTDAVGGIYNGLPSGLSMTTFELSESGIESYNNFIKKIIDKNKIDSIVSVFLVPTGIVLQSILPDLGVANKKEVITKPKYYSLIKRDDNTKIKNNKLYTSPYNFLYVTNMQGNSACFPYEFFNGNECKFQWFGDFSPNPSVALVPMFYKGVPENYDEKMILSGYPQISFNVDTYKAWLAQNRGTLAVEALSLGASIAVGAVTGTTALQVASIGAKSATKMITQGLINDQNNAITSINTFMNTSSLLASVHQKSIMPDQTRGGGDPLLMASANLINFMFMPKYIRPEFVTIIDDYFNMYGYATRKVKIPNTNSRPHWNYVKTIGCNIFSKTMPSSGVDVIKNIYDNGITFWKHTSIVGDYSQDNSVEGDE